MSDGQKLTEWSRCFTVETSQCDITGAIRISALLEKMQDAANEHCRMLHVGWKDLVDKNLSWIVFKTDVQIHQYPALGDRVTVQTFTRGSQYKFYPRYFLALDDQGNVLCRIASLWMLMDRTTRKTAAPSVSGISMPDAVDRGTTLKISSLARRVEGVQRMAVYRPRYADIDVNGHVNNTRYVDWMCNQLGLEFMREREFSFVSIDYSYEVRPDDQMECTLAMNDRELQFFGCAGGRQKFSIYGELRPRDPQERGEKK